MIFALRFTNWGVKDEEKNPRKKTKKEGDDDLSDYGSCENHSSLKLLKQNPCCFKLDCLMLAVVIEKVIM